MTVAGEQRAVSRETMERHVGRKLQSSELVHHRDGDPWNNAIENLQIVSRAAHKRLHPEIGMATRLKKIWRINPYAALIRTMAIGQNQAAKHYGCSDKTVGRAIATVFGGYRAIWNLSVESKVMIIMKGMKE